MQATPSPTAGPTSTTVRATAAPVGAIRVQLAGPPPHYEPASLSAKAGDVVFFLDNTSLGTHTLAIGTALYHPLVVSGSVAKGESAVFTVRGLRAGSYIIFCTIDNHAAEGMVGTLIVR